MVPKPTQSDWDFYLGKWTLTANTVMPRFFSCLTGSATCPWDPPISDKDEDLGHRGISVPRKPFAQKVFQSKACLCAPSSELTQQEKKQRRKSQQPWEVKLEWEPETMGSSITSDAALSQQRL